MKRITPDDIKFSLQEAYNEYRRLRSNVAVKRLHRLEAAGFSEASIYRDYAYILRMPAGKIAPSDIKKALSDMYNFIEGGSTVKAVRSGYQKAASALQSHGYDIKASDVPEFRRFMDSVSDRYGAKRESGSAADVYAEMKNAGLLNSKKNRDEVLRHFDFYRSHLSEVIREKKGTGESLSDIRKRISAKGR